MNPPRAEAFPPHAGPESRVLILGSLPGTASLAAQQYYAHPQNQFWRLVGDAIDTDLTALDYPERLAALTAHRIGLWDTIASARRVGSLDAAIREAETRDIAAFAATLPDLRVIACNGATAARHARTALADSAIPLLALPSSSAAHARLPYAAKLQQWRQIAAWIQREPPPPDHRGG